MVIPQALPLIRLENVCLRYPGERELLWRDVSFSIQAGELWCVLGPNGVGKSSLLRVMAGLQKPTAGQVFWQEKKVAEYSAMQLAHLRAYCPAVFTETFPITVKECVALARYPFGGDAAMYGVDTGMTESEQHRINQALQAFDLKNLASRNLQYLSSGERQRVALAAAFAQEVGCVMLDEPLAYLDLSHQYQVMERLIDLKQQQGKTLVLTMHDLNWTLRCATHVLLLYRDGRWHAGPAHEMMQPDLLEKLFGVRLQCVTQDGQRWLLSC